MVTLPRPRPSASAPRKPHHPAGPAARTHARLSKLKPARPEGRNCNAGVALLGPTWKGVLSVPFKTAKKRNPSKKRRFPPPEKRRFPPPPKKGNKSKTSTRHHKTHPCRVVSQTRPPQQVATLPFPDIHVFARLFAGQRWARMIQTDDAAHLGNERLGNDMDMNFHREPFAHHLPGHPYPR